MYEVFHPKYVNGFHLFQCSIFCYSFTSYWKLSFKLHYFRF